MPKSPKMNTDFTFILKLNKEDRKMLDEIQLSGINASDEFRKFIKILYKEKIKIDNEIYKTNKNRHLI